MYKNVYHLSIYIYDSIMPILKVLLEYCKDDFSLLFPAFQSDRQMKNCVKAM